MKIKFVRGAATNTQQLQLHLPIDRVARATVLIIDQ